MPPEAAQLVLLAITVIAVLVWAISLHFLVGAFQAGRARPTNEFADRESAPSANTLTGSAAVDQPPAVLTTRAAAVLAKTSPFGTIKIVEKTEDRITFERLGPTNRWLRRGELRFAATGPGRSRVDWAAELNSMNWLLSLGVLFQLLGASAVVTGYALISTYVVSSPNGAVRWQTIQMLQVMHFIWPPFLFAGLYRRGRREIAAQFEGLVHNLPYSGD
jgi:hypothetical protein